MNQLYSPNDVAKLIGVSKDTIKVWERNSFIPKGSRMGLQKRRIWSRAQVILIIRFAKDIGYPVFNEKVFMSGGS